MLDGTVVRTVYGSSVSGAPQPHDRRLGYQPTFADFGFDGLAALRFVVAASPYGTVEQAVASLSVFSHPKTVEQTGGKALFRVIRNIKKRGEIQSVGVTRVAYDDNTAPADAFLWCNALRPPREAQFNHVFRDSQNPETYTSLANLCLTPAFLAKVTDTVVEIRSLLAYRVYDLYGWVPSGVPVPAEPSIYRGLIWASPLPPVIDVRAAVLAAMSRRKRHRTTRVAREIGWLFEDPVVDRSEPASRTPG